jgi:hypothetical protein
VGYLKNTLVAFDCWANTLRGGLPGVTISSDAARARDRGEAWGVNLCRVLDGIEANHCDKALIGDMARSAAVAEYLRNNPGASVKEVLAAVPVPPVSNDVAKAVGDALPVWPLSANTNTAVAAAYSQLWRETIDHGA